MIDTSKVIHAPVGGGRYTVTAPIVKEDYGLYLLIEGLELPSTYEVDFSNSEHSGASVTMIGNSDGVLIPSQFISSGKDVFAFLYHVGADFGRTVYKFRIPNKLRPDRTNEQPTPEEQSVIDQAIAALNDAVEQTAQDVIDADASAQSASESAEQAQESARTAGLYSDTAQTYANSAEISANSASASATASAQSASQSAQIKDDVESMVDDAQASADASERSASNAYTYATSAERSSVNASSSAQSASGYASQAQTSAQTASSKATEASGYASTASTKASESAQSASQALTYKTDAESAKTASQTAQGLAESARDLAQGYAEDAQGYANDAQASAEGISASASQIAQNTANILKAFPTDTASGAVASFSDGADNIPLKSLIVNIDPVQDTSSGDPSPENICPISGWTGAKVARTGKNLFDNNTDNIHSFTVYNETEGDFVSVKGYELSLPQGTYRVSASYIGDATTSYIFGGVIDADGYFVPLERLVNNKTLVPHTITVGKNQKVCYYNGNRTQSMAVTRTMFARFNIQLEVGSTATDYEPYQGRIILINWQTEAGTVYGGKLDVLTGKLTVYPEYDSYNGETLTGRWISDRDVYASGTTPTIGAQVVNVGAQGTEIQLEPHEVASLRGTNNIFADTGDISAEYRADTTLYISRLTEPDADMIADSNIVSGQYFMVGNNLYLATANIASGSAVIVGTNATRKSLSEALNEINS